ncbi:MAG: type II toxin-antitoxin system death-on-curing family toxin [Candidatus Blackburnbacteria bacterium]|nr:type II toxin-antitoxin system death-on-curing family toxin [Candidatus Blackburnbacteria bacterium]
MKFVSLEETYAIHERMLQIGGGRAGIHDFAMLHSAIERPKAQFGGKYLYDTIWLMAGAFLQSMVRNQPFEDANKRTAYFTTKRLLFKNGYMLQPKRGEVLKFMVNVDVKRTSTEQIAAWLEKSSKKQIQAQGL